MVVGHLSGEPEDPTPLYITSRSILGIPGEKAQVTVDHLIEIAGYRGLDNVNHLYDKKGAPKYKLYINSNGKNLFRF